MEDAIIELLQKTHTTVAGVLVVGVDGDKNAVSKLLTAKGMDHQLYPVFIDVLEELLKTLKEGDADFKTLN